MELVPIVYIVSAKVRVFLQDARHVIERYSLSSTAGLRRFRINVSGTTTNTLTIDSALKLLLKTLYNSISSSRRLTSFIFAMVRMHPMTQQRAQGWTAWGLKVFKIASSRISGCPREIPEIKEDQQHSLIHPRIRKQSNLNGLIKPPHTAAEVGEIDKLSGIHPRVNKKIG